MRKLISGFRDDLRRDDLTAFVTGKTGFQFPIGFLRLSQPLLSRLRCLPPGRGVIKPGDLVFRQDRLLIDAPELRQPVRETGDSLRSLYMSRPVQDGLGDIPRGLPLECPSCPITGSPSLSMRGSYTILPEGVTRGGGGCRSTFWTFARANSVWSIRKARYSSSATSSPWVRQIWETRDFVSPTVSAIC